MAKLCSPDPGATNAADLKFLRWLPLLRNRNFKSKCGTRNIELLVILWFPKFVLEVAATVHELRKRVTSVTETGRSKAHSSVPDAVQRPLRCSAKPGPQEPFGDLDPGSAVHR
jgi:hypothetical protein